ncbi:MAG: molybdenum cofactor biosynthesis protein MoaE [Verrucomicrobiales bacterium]
MNSASTTTPIPFPRVTTRVAPDRIPQSFSFGSPRHGAEICFRGVVRGEEKGQPIAGIRYSAYLPMAQATLRSLAEDTAAAHPDALIHVHHVIGEVAAGEASLLLAVATPHSAEAMELLEHLLRRLKEEVPIWKEFLPTSQCP